MLLHAFIKYFFNIANIRIMQYVWGETIYAEKKIHKEMFS